MLAQFQARIDLRVENETAWVRLVGDALELPALSQLATDFLQLGFIAHGTSPA